MTSGQPQAGSLAPGLYLVSTPLGNARDITLRALDILRAAEVLAAEDTRSLRRLMEIHGVALAGRKIIAYHDHNGPRARPGLLQALAEGRSLAYASEAGTPLVADPGYALAKAAIDAGHPVHAAPGPVAAIAALTLSGLPTDMFTFAGFPPNAAGARGAFLRALAHAPGTLILYESPRRIAATLTDAAEILGDERPAALGRELTKKFEEVLRGTLRELARHVAESEPRGEMVLCIGRDASGPDREGLEDALRRALETSRLKDAATEISEAFGVPRREVYQLGLRLGRERD